MSALLFELPPAVDVDARSMLYAYREELEREIESAIRAAGDADPEALDIEEAREIFRQLGDDGDTSAAREQLTDALSFCWPGAGALHDVLMDHVNTIGWAHWRLYRAERRTYHNLIP